MSHGFGLNLATMMLFVAATPSAHTRGAAIAPVLQLTPSPVVGGNPVNGTVTVASAAPAGGTTVTIGSSSILIAPLVNPNLGPSSAVTSLTLVIPQGQTSTTFRINTLGVAAPSTATIRVVVGSEVTNATLTVMPASALSVAVSPNGVVGGQPAGVTVTLDGKAPPSGATVNLTATVTNLAPSGGQFPLTMPVSLPVAPGAQSVGAPILTIGVSSPSSVIVTASLGRQATTTFTIFPPSPASVQLDPARVLGGVATTGTVVLNTRAPSSGYAVALTSSSVSAAVPASITVPANTDRQTFNISTTAVTRATQVIVTAKPATSATQTTTGGITTTISDGSSNTIVPGQVSATLTLDAPPTASSIAVNPATVLGGKASTGTVVLSGPAPASGIAVGLTSSSADVILPKSITIPPGSDRQTFQVATRSVTTTTPVKVSALNPSGGVSAALEVLEQPRLQSVVVQPSGVVGGSPVNIAATFTTSQSALSAAAMSTYAAAVTSSTNHPELVQLPTSFSVSSTASSTTLTATSGLTATGSANTNVPTTDQPVSVAVTLGSASASTSFTVRAPVPPIQRIVITPTFANNGATLTLSIVLSPAITTSQTIQLTTDHPEIITLPASVVVVPGRVFALSFITRGATAQTAVTITAIAGTQRVQSSFTISPP